MSDLVRNLEKIFKAAGDRNRLRVINMLTLRAMCVCEIQAILKVSQSTVSGHLKVLREAGLVTDSREGLWVEYHLEGETPFARKMLSCITDQLRDDPVMTRERQEAGRVSRENLKCGV